jgi:Domain of unknown function (DUF4276)
VIRVHVIVEGQTEESFVREVLAPTLWTREIYLFPTLLGVPGHKGGKPNYARLRKDVLIQLKQDRTAYCSTMIDFYGLEGEFPGMPFPPDLQSIRKVVRIEEAVKADVVAELPDLRPDIRFLPYLQLHEFEGLLFSDPAAFADGIKQQLLRGPFEAVRAAFATPEDINDNANTAPSKRVLSLYPGYRKPLDGTLAAKAVGINRMRQECPHFRSWIEQLEALGT